MTHSCGYDYESSRRVCQRCFMDITKPTNKKPVKVYIINDIDSLEDFEKSTAQFDNSKERVEFELMTFAKGNTYRQIASIIPDRSIDNNAKYVCIMSLHNSMNGRRALCQAAELYFKNENKKNPCDILSIASTIEGDYIMLKAVLRYYREVPDIKEFYNQLNENIKKDYETGPTTGNLVVPDEIANVKYSEEEIYKHEADLRYQKVYLDECSKERPFLNSIDTYVRDKLYDPADDIPLIYDLKSKDMQTCTITPYDEFIKIFAEIMSNYVTGTEYNEYTGVLLGNIQKELFMSSVEEYINTNYVRKHRLPKEDVSTMLKRIEKALFEMYVVQDLIDDPKVTDIKITAPDSIRARIHGKAYLSNITFVDVNDYMRFMGSVILKNGIDTSLPTQVVTDEHDENYILRVSYTSAYINSSGLPSLHIRKVARHKMLGNDLIKAGMMDEKIRDYLLDCGKNSRGVVFAGPPGSGKTVALNWFIEEAYEQSAEILVIQESDELFTYKKGVMFEHVVTNPSQKKNEQAVTLEKLGQMALVAGVNVFVIGEAKGAEICSAITLSNSGCRTAITVHSPSSTETINKMADLAMRGWARDMDQAKRMLKSFETIVYLQDFKVQEISRIIGYDEEKHDMIYQYIYRRDAEKNADADV